MQVEGYWFCRPSMKSDSREAREKAYLKQRSEIAFRMEKEINNGTSGEGFLRRLEDDLKAIAGDSSTVALRAIRIAGELDQFVILSLATACSASVTSSSAPSTARRKLCHLLEEKATSRCSTCSRA